MLPYSYLMYGVLVHDWNDFVISCVDTLSVITHIYMQSLVWIGFRMWDVKIRHTEYVRKVCQYANARWVLAKLLAEAAHLADPAPEWPNFPFHNDSFPAPLTINNRLRTRPCECCTTCGSSKSPAVPPPPPSCPRWPLSLSHIALTDFSNFTNYTVSIRHAIVRNSRYNY